jgi:hypothetical protein
MGRKYDPSFIYSFNVKKQTLQYVTYYPLSWKYSSGNNEKRRKKNPPSWTFHSSNYCNGVLFVRERVVKERRIARQRKAQPNRSQFLLDHFSCICKFEYFKWISCIFWYLVLAFSDRVSLCSPGWSSIHDLPASDSQVLGL